MTAHRRLRAHASDWTRAACFGVLAALVGDVAARFLQKPPAAGRRDVVRIAKERWEASHWALDP